MLHDKLYSSLTADVCEAGWYDLLNLYRNKIAHLGSPAIRKFGFHDCARQQFMIKLLGKIG
jgi:hypothetical protein